MLTIYTRTSNLLTIEFWKWVTKRLARKRDGPYAVLASLTRGLHDLRIDYELNPLLPANDTVLVVSGPLAVRDAVRMKRARKISKLIVGPNIVIHPHDSERIMLDEVIDIILVPSQWVADFWTHEAPELTAKIRVWPSGITECNASTRIGKPIIYDKLGDHALVQRIQQIFNSSARVFTYGSFAHKDYLSALSDAPYLIYLSGSESQGLALQEAWAHDVPTLVNKSTTWKKGNLSWEAQQINCPYMVPELGSIFEDVEKIPAMIEQLHTLRPKSYADIHLSDRVSIRKLLELL